MKTRLNNDRGIALVTALLLTMLCLAIVMALMYMVGQGTKLSGAHKRYKNSLEASHGGVQLVTKDIIPKLFNSYSSSEIRRQFNSINLDTSSSACLNQKLSLSPVGWTACAAAATSLDPKTGWDMSFKLQAVAGPGFNIYAKIIDTMPGNSDTSGFELLDAGAGVTGSASGLSPKHIPALYRIEIQGESAGNTREKAVLSALYAY